MRTMIVATMTLAAAVAGLAALARTVNAASGPAAGAVRHSSQGSCGNADGDSIKPKGRRLSLSPNDLCAASATTPPVSEQTPEIGVSCQRECGESGRLSRLPLATSG